MRNLLMLTSAALTASFLLVAAGCDSSEPESQNAVLVNRSGEPIVYRLGAIPSGPPEPLVDVELGSGFRLVPDKDSAVFSTCNTDVLEENNNLIVYEALELSEDEKTATIATNEVVSNTELADRFRDNNCRVVVDSLS